jgi:ParB family chromosome partitioning protein
MGQGHGENALPWGGALGDGGGSVASAAVEGAWELELGEVQWVPVSAIAVGAFRLRGAIAASEIETLAQSIARQGLLSPLLGRSREGEPGYDLIAGERRLRAVQHLGWHQVPLRVLPVSVANAWEMALIENLQRQDLDVLEETEAILTLLALRLGMEVAAVPRLLQRLAKGQQRRSRSATGQGNSANPAPARNPEVHPEPMALIQETFAALGAGQWRSFVRNRLPVLQLPPPLLAVLRQKQLPYTKVLAIAQVRDEGVRAQLLDLALTQGWSLRQIRQWVRQRSAAASSGEWGQWRSRLDRLQRGLQALEGRSRSAVLGAGDRDRVERLLTELEQVLQMPIDPP